ncbi:MAG: hypothetical protein U5R30_10300 [Deltaproteobacteria bacterium]|nr:hypothetical protein [Deltaproteobacteria bacterium]
MINATMTKSFMATLWTMAIALIHQARDLKQVVGVNIGMTMISDREPIEESGCKGAARGNGQHVIHYRQTLGVGGRPEDVVAVIPQQNRIRYAEQGAGVGFQIGVADDIPGGCIDASGGGGRADDTVEIDSWRCRMVMTMLMMTSTNRTSHGESTGHGNSAYLSPGMHRRRYRKRLGSA